MHKGGRIEREIEREMTKRIYRQQFELRILCLNAFCMSVYFLYVFDYKLKQATGNGKKSNQRKRIKYTTCFDPSDLFSRNWAARIHSLLSRSRNRQHCMHTIAPHLQTHTITHVSKWMSSYSEMLRLTIVRSVWRRDLYCSYLREGK